MAVNRKTSVLPPITAAQARSASQEGYVKYVDPTESAAADKDKRMTRDQLAQLDRKRTPLVGTTWDGTNKAKTLTANLSLTFSPGNNQFGDIKLIQGGAGSYTVSIDGTDYAINTAVGSKTFIHYRYDDVANEYDFWVSSPGASIAGGVGDTTAPTIESITVEDADPTKIILTYSETLDASSVPALIRFIFDEGSAGAGFTGAAVISGNTVTLTRSTPIGAGELHDLGYTGNEIKDAAGNSAATFSVQSITNNVGGDTTAPTVLSATATDANTIHVVFSESVNATTAGWSFKKNGSPLTLNSVSGGGSTWDFDVATMLSTDTILRSYNSGTGNTLDIATNELVSFTDQAVTNSISGGGANQPETDTWVAAEETLSGGTIDPTLEAAADDVVVALKAGTLWAKMDSIHLVGPAGVLNLKDPDNDDASHRLEQLPGSAATRGADGWTHDGVDDVLNTNYTPTSSRNEHYSIYIKSCSVDGYMYGGLGPSFGSYFCPKTAGGAISGRIQTSGDLSGGANATVAGRYIASVRNDGTTVYRRIAKNGSIVYTADSAIGGDTGGPANVAMYLGAFYWDASGNPAGLALGTWGWLTQGQGLTNAEIAELDGIMSAFITATSRT